MFSFLLAGALIAPAVFADDKWDLSSRPELTDDDSSTPNELWHGMRQTHDIQGVSDPILLTPTDRDWMVVETKAGHSYEVRMFNTNLRVDLPGVCTFCANVDRVDSAGSVLTAGQAPNGAGTVSSSWAHSQVVRWMGTADQRDFIRVEGDNVFSMGANDQYDIELMDTTYFVPRWNHNGTQTTVFLIQNASTAPVTGDLLLYNAAGVLLHTQPLSIPRNGVQVFAAASVPALAGQSGSAAIVHTGGYGALAGKAVGLEPSTGFTFDTPIAAVPR